MVMRQENLLEQAFLAKDELLNERGLLQSGFHGVGYYKSILDEAGISTFIRNEHTGNPVMSGAMFLLSLCVVQDTDYDEALRLLKSRQVKESGTGVESRWVSFPEACFGLACCSGGL